MVSTFSWEPVRAATEAFWEMATGEPVEWLT